MEWFPGPACLRDPYTWLFLWGDRGVQTFVMLCLSPSIPFSHSETFWGSKSIFHTEQLCWEGRRRDCSPISRGTALLIKGTVSRQPTSPAWDKHTQLGLWKTKKQLLYRAGYREEEQVIWCRRGAMLFWAGYFCPCINVTLVLATVANGATQLLFSESPAREGKGGGLFIFPQGWDGERLALPLAGAVHQLLPEEESILEPYLPGHSEEKSCIVWKAQIPHIIRAKPINVWTDKPAQAGRDAMSPWSTTCLGLS